RATLIFIMASAIVFSGCAGQKSGVHLKSDDSGDVQAKNTITSIEVKDNSDSSRVLIKGQNSLTYTSVKQPDPFGIVLYFPETTSGQNLNASKLDSNLLKDVSISQVGADNGTARVEILLENDADYNVNQINNVIEILFNKPLALAKNKKDDSDSAISDETESNTYKDSGNETPIVEKTHSEALPKQPQQQVSVEKKVAVQSYEQAWVNRLDFVSETDGKSTFSIGASSPFQHTIRKIGDKRLELKLLKTNIPEYRQRPLITTRFNSAVDRILPIQLPSMEDFSIITIELRESVPYSTELVGSLLLVHFDASTVSPRPLDESDLPAWKKAFDTPVPASEFESERGDGVNAMNAPQQERKIKKEKVLSNGEIDVESALTYKAKTKIYTGEKIALDFYETDVKNVFRILREVSAKNFAIDKDVTGKVTLTLEQPVPWDQVLDLVLRMNQLGMVFEGNIIRIATLETLKKEDDLRKARFEAAAKAKEQIKSQDPLVTRYIPISYSKASTEILPHIENIITKDRGSVTVDERNNQIIFTDTVEKVDQAVAIAKRIDRVTSQVIIEARVVEVSEDYKKELGFAWSATIGGVTFNGGDSSHTTYLAMNYPAATSSGFGFNLARVVNTNFALDAELSALETSGNGKILSAPKIVTLDNKKARIKQGLEYAYLERDSSGGATVKFKDIDLLLEVTPHVTPDNRISMIIHLTKDDVASLTDGVPSIATNEAETELLINDGDTIVIGGIIKSQTTVDDTGFPGLGKIPVLGWLFKHHLDEGVKKELLIFINPKIVRLEKSLGAGF
ncbi:MAG: type IV pilus secretin PilQ, partial [Bacteroidetes bacterium]|nr:type IV pilus secretin PilQ [Bacteroidota bacterium]